MSLKRFCTRCWERASKMSWWTSGLIGAGLLFGAGLLDWVTGPEAASSVLYLAPISWLTLTAGRGAGIGMAVISGSTWLSVELLTHSAFANPVIPFWNAIVRTSFFCLVSGLESEVLERKRVERGLRQAKEELEQRVHERTAQLQAVNANLEERVAERSAAAEDRARQLARSEAELQRQTGILQSILDSMGDGVVVADSQGRLMLINPAARRILRLPSSDTNVVAWLESREDYPPEGMAGLERGSNPLLGAVRGEAVDGAEMLLRHDSFPKGVWLSVTGRPLLDQDRRIMGGVIVLSDISAQKDLERQIAEVSDREQRRIGEDLHDGLCQHLVSTALAARTLTAKLSDRSLPEREDAAEIAELLSESISQAREVARGLYLVPLEAGGLSSALEDLAAQVRSRHHISCEFVGKVSSPILEEATLTGLFRIAQEAVNNAIKHAQAGQILVTLAADEQQIQLSIEDDGAGIHTRLPPAGGMGMHLMNYRARTIGAVLHVGPRAGGGTIVSCSMHRLPPAQPSYTHVGRD